MSGYGWPSTAAGRPGAVWRPAGGERPAPAAVPGAAPARGGKTPAGRAARGRFPLRHGAEKCPRRMRGSTVIGIAMQTNGNAGATARGGPGHSGTDR